MCASCSPNEGNGLKVREVEIHAWTIATGTLSCPTLGDASVPSARQHPIAGIPVYGNSLGMLQSHAYMMSDEFILYLSQ